MRTFGIGCALALVLAGGAVAQGVHYVSGYVRSDGTYVAPHYQTNPNNTRNDNFSTRGNIDPYTGQAGTKPPDNGFGVNGFPLPYNPYSTPFTPYGQQPYVNPNPYGATTEDPDD